MITAALYLLFSKSTLRMASMVALARDSVFRKQLWVNGLRPVKVNLTTEISVGRYLQL